MTPSLHAPTLARRDAFPWTTSARLPRRAALMGLLALPLAACAGGSEESDGPASDGDGAASGEVTVTDPWVKAAEDGMTAAFGLLRNGTDRDLTLVAASTPASSDVQLHETSTDGSGGMSMAEKEGGFPIPAGGELALEPGGDHLMFMTLSEPLEPGAEVEILLQFEDGTEVPITATVKDYAGADEEYSSEETGETEGMGSDGGGAMDHEGMDHEGMDHDGTDTEE